MHQDEPRLELLQIVTRQVEAGDVRAHGLRQPRQQFRKACGIAVGGQRIHRPASGAQLCGERRQVRVRIPGTQRHHAVEYRAIALVRQVAQTGIEQYHFAGVVRREVVPLARMLEPAGGEEAHCARQVIVTTHTHNEAHLLADVGLQRGEQRGADCVAEGEHTGAAAGGKFGAADQVGERIRDLARVRGADAQFPKTGKVGHQHRKAGTRQGRSESGEARVVLALRHRAGYHHDGGARAVLAARARIL